MATPSPLPPFSVDLTKLMALGAKSSQANPLRPKIVLLLGGSFAPCHIGHVESFHRARTALAEKYNIDVIGGFLNVTSDKHVVDKLGAEKAMSLELRAQTCEMSCASSDLVSVIASGEASTAVIRLLLLGMIKALQLDWSTAEVECLNLCGADMICKGAYLDKDVVCLEREGFDMTKALQDREAAQSKTYLVDTDEKLVGASSTRCRAMLLGGEFDAVRECGLLAPAVVDYFESIATQKRLGAFGPPNCFERGSPVPFPHYFAEWPLVKACMQDTRSDLAQLAGYLQRITSDPLGPLYTGGDSSVVSIELLAFIFDRALEIDELFPTPASVADMMVIGSKKVTMTQRQACSILACAWLRKIPRLYFNFAEKPGVVGSKRAEGKVRCLAAYFNACKKRFEASSSSSSSSSSSWQGTMLSFIRRSLDDEEAYRGSLASKSDWFQQGSALAMSPFVVRPDAVIEAAHGCLQADFANKKIGGGILFNGLAHEEMRFAVCPDCIASILFFDNMADGEAVLLQGIEQFASSTGYADTFLFDGPFDDSTPIDEATGHRKTSLVAFDALPFKDELHPPQSQYEEANVLRELRKVLISVLAWEGEEEGEAIKPFATGNWGAGAFRGDPQFKCLIQWVACSIAKRPVEYFPFTDKKMAPHAMSALTSIASAERYRLQGDEEQQITQVQLALEALFGYEQHLHEVAPDKTFAEFLHELVEARRV